MGFRFGFYQTLATKTWMVVAVAVGWFPPNAAANPLVSMTKPVWGCVDPNVAPVMNDDRNPNRLDQEWVERTEAEGQCVLISPQGVWEPLSQDHNGLTYVAYRGTTGRPGSFWVPTATMTIVTPAKALPPPALAPLPPAPVARVAPPPSRPAPPLPPAASGPANTTAQTPTPSEQAAPETTEPSISVTNASTTSQGGSAGGGLTMLLFLFGGGWMLRRLLRRKKVRVRRAANRVPMQTRSHVPAMSGNQPGSMVSSPNGVSTTAGKVHAELQSSPRKKGVPTKDNGKASHTWILPGNPVTIAGVTVPDGMVYMGRSTGQWGNHDASFLDPSLPVARSATTAGPLGYWPSYKAITSECRRSYLEWLASGKQAPDADIGYVFLYFYGLERRLLLDAPPVEEVRAIVAELHRLRRIYAENNSFNGYSNRLLEAVAFLQAAATLDAQIFVPDLKPGCGEMSFSLKVAIAREVVAGRSLSFELSSAALFGLRDFWSAHRQVLDKASAAFLTVLRARFASAFPTGFSLRNRKDSHLHVVYRGASAGLSVNLAARAGLNDLPDPVTLTWTKLLALGSAVAEELASYAKALAYHPARAGALHGLVGCPAELRNVIAPEARQWLDALPSLAAVPFGELAGHAIGTSTAKWTIRHRRQVSEALSAVGYVMEPDPEDGTEHLEDSTTVQVFRCTSTTRSRPMDVASAAAMLVAAVSRTADEGAKGSVEHWLSRLPSRLSLTSDQMTRIRARLAWLDGKNVTLAKAKRILGNANLEEREFCVWSATVAAGATGRVGKPQVALLEAIHDALDVPRDALYAGLHAGIGAATSVANEPILVSQETSEILHPIPRPPTAEPVDSDAGRLDRIRAETERVSAMLADIFVEDEPHTQASEPAGEGILAGLDAKHSKLLSRLLSREEWARVEFDGVTSEIGLMPGGAMETINEWAFDHLGDAILDDGDVVAINRTLLSGDLDAIAAE